MDWEQKLQAITALDPDASLHISRNGKWSVRSDISIMDRISLSGKAVAEDTPEAAVETEWKNYTELTSAQHLVVHWGGAAKEKHVRWNGFMWQDVPYKQPNDRDCI